MSRAVSSLVAVTSVVGRHCYQANGRSGRLAILLQTQPTAWLGIPSSRDTRETVPEPRDDARSLSRRAEASSDGISYSNQPRCRRAIIHADLVALTFLRSKRHPVFSSMKSRMKNVQRSITILNTSGREPESWLDRLASVLAVATVAFEHERGRFVPSFSRSSPRSSTHATALARYGSHREM